MNYLTKEEIFRDNGISTAYANTGLNAQQLIAIIQATQKALEAKNKAEAVTGLCNCERPVDHCTFKSNCQVINAAPQPNRTAELEEQVKVLRQAVSKVTELRGNIYESESKNEMQALIDAFWACETALAETKGTES